MGWKLRFSRMRSAAKFDFHTGAARDHEDQAAEAYVTGAPKARVITLAGDDAPLYVATVSIKTIERVAPALVRTQIQLAVDEDAPPPVPLGDDVCVVGERTFAAATRCPPGRAVLAFLGALARDDDDILALPRDAVFEAPARLAQVIDEVDLAGDESPKTTPATMATAAIAAAVATVDGVILAKALSLLLGEASLVVVGADGGTAGDVALGPRGTPQAAALARRAGHGFT